MTTFDRFEGDLPMLLEELAPPRTPDYLDSVFGRTARSRQRAAWTFPERWLPMSTITERMAPLPRVPVRLLVILVLLLTALAVTALYVGSQQLRQVPAPFGVAGNGKIAYVMNDDIYTFDPATGTSQAIVGGSEAVTSPIYSPDGQHLAFLRHTPSVFDWYDLVVAAADGSDQKVINGKPLGVDDGFAWYPDGRSIMVGPSDHTRIIRYEVAAKGDPLLVAAMADDADFRPPAGDQIIFRKAPVDGSLGLYLANADGSGPRPLLELAPGESTGGEDLYYARWSPDGSTIVFVRTPPGLHDLPQLYAMNADGTGVRPLPIGVGTTDVNDPQWSPDGTRIAFRRFGGSNHDIQPVGVLTLSSGEVQEVGPVLADGNVQFRWSPDGKEILEMPGGGEGPLVAVEVESGQTRTIVESLGESVPFDWQRVAPAP